MRPVSTFVVSPSIPNELLPLKELAYNYWWCWSSEATELFRRLDTQLWDEVRHNPVQMLGQLSQERLQHLAKRPEYVNAAASVLASFRSYMDSPGWYSTLETHPASYIAYFCAEFGIHESFSSYSGGLGVLAGDHLKSASDLGLPLVAVGLLYQEGYFRQYLTENGWQNEQYQEVDFFSLPLTHVSNADGSPLLISVDMPLGTCFAQIWKVNVGRIPLYLLDTNVPQNTDPALRDVTDRLYGGSINTRIMQEMMLGIGGMRALQALGIDPSVCHVNEGHAAFFMLERTHQFMNRFGINFREAWRMTQTSSVFTTHTPVPAGNEVFEHSILEPYFRNYVEGMGLPWADFLDLGSMGKGRAETGFSMTVLGLRGSSYRNGVSALHGVVAREMWHGVWEQFSLDEVPIQGLVNGVHTTTWVAPELGEIYDRYLGSDWRTEPWKESSWAEVDSIPSIELWRVHQRRRDRLVLGAREHILSKHHASLTQEQVSTINECLDPDILTIGFARRFASYKRADLLMRDMERLSKIILNADRPVQFILAGKAHPKDTLGKELIQNVHEMIKEFHLQKRIVFLEDYDMDTARLMVRGCDVWLNTPRRPHEASGTSGMKAAINGVLHCSILDGWWAEGYDGKNGWAIGRGEVFEPEEQDQADSITLYDVLEHGIIPLFYDVAGSRVPERWVAMMKHNIKTNAWKFAAQRMVRDYTLTAYLPAMAGYAAITANNGQQAKEMVSFFDGIDANWQSVKVSDVTVHGASHANVGKRIHVTARVDLGSIPSDAVIVQIVFGSVDSKGEIKPAETKSMTLLRNEGHSSIFEGDYECERTGMNGCTVRVIPVHPALHSIADAHHVAYPPVQI
ncbi:MAG: alpha-glucan family phosphorylase [Ignavibacteria bacterium]|nr:alpha-glucan family phosphorylase [Ignavibacteria bacterium]MBK6760177.1 alpha-glucan family phosphorylase [Ignavibacteria bacterium]MBK7034079.1 alpha-glucan family phosphorylase [Ignavibacteria bacterium]MBK7412036.1 alpha-glucan family phosphorylase [Ignavibacteria bacterium]MBK9182567.1 alpha-glucan family phosphorylase [Ignavibacteria bacterium]